MKAKTQDNDLAKLFLGNRRCYVLKCIVLIFLSTYSFSFADKLADWEAQKYYDPYLSAVLIELRTSIDSDAWPDCREFINSPLITKSPGCRLGYAIKDEIIPISNIPRSYKYYLVAANNHGVQIKAENNFGGRSYIYNSEWNVAYYIFQTPIETRNIGKVLIEWLVDKNLNNDKWKYYAIALGFRG
jgi:hypothetical protein